LTLRTSSSLQQSRPRDGRRDVGPLLVQGLALLGQLTRFHRAFGNRAQLGNADVQLVQLRLQRAHRVIGAALHAQGPVGQGLERVAGVGILQRTLDRGQVLAGLRQLGERLVLRVIGALRECDRGGQQPGGHQQAEQRPQQGETRTGRQTSSTRATRGPPRLGGL